MAPPKTYRKISRNSAPWAVPATISCGVRTNFLTVRPAIVRVETSLDAPGSNVATAWAVRWLWWS